MEGYYKPILSINLEHPFYGKDQDMGLSFTFAEQTLKQLKNHRIIAKPRLNGIDFLAQFRSNKFIIPIENIRLLILLKVKDNSLLQRTLLPEFQPNKAFLFKKITFEKTTSPVIKFAKEDLFYFSNATFELPYQDSDNLIAKNYMNEVLSEGDGYKKVINEDTVKFSLLKNDINEVRLFRGTEPYTNLIAFHNEYQHKLAGLEVNLEDHLMEDNSSENHLNLKISLEAKKAYWRYKFFHKNRAYKTIAIHSEEEELQFQKEEGENDEVDIFISNQPIPCDLARQVKLQLQDTESEMTIVERLPIPKYENFKKHKEIKELLVVEKFVYI